MKKVILKRTGMSAEIVEGNVEVIEDLLGSFILSNSVSTFVAGRFQFLTNGKGLFVVERVDGDGKSTDVNQADLELINKLLTEE